MLLDTCKLRHIGWGFFVRHIDTVAVLAAEDAVHIVAVLIATVVGLDTLNPYVYKAPSDYELLRFVRTAQKAPYVGDMKFKRSGVALAASLRSLSGCARGCRSEYNDQSFHWLH